MGVPLWSLLSSGLCLGIVVLISFVIFLIMRRGKEARLRQLEEETLAEAGLRGTPDAATRWSNADLAESASPEAALEMAVCPACGAENPASAQVCAYCGRQQ